MDEAVWFLGESWEMRPCLLCTFSRAWRCRAASSELQDPLTWFIAFYAIASLPAQGLIHSPVYHKEKNMKKKKKEKTKKKKTGAAFAVWSSENIQGKEMREGVGKDLESHFLVRAEVEDDI